MRHIRAFFDTRDYTEVDTPVLSPVIIPESSIEIFESYFLSPYTQGTPKKTPLYLAPSPELWMKRLLCRGWGNIYQISKCFRNCESIGKHHNPEFSMLEWYTIQADYHDSARLCSDLLASFEDIGTDNCVTNAPLFITIDELFHEAVHIDISHVGEAGHLVELLLGADIPVSHADTLESAFNTAFVLKCEPWIPKDRPVFITDYPDYIRCLAENSHIPGRVERWELYLQGIETANCFSERRNPRDLKDYYEVESREKQKSRVIPLPDTGLLDEMILNMPVSSGTAMGLDRLVMAICGIQDIRGVIQFPVSDRIL